MSPPPFLICSDWGACKWAECHKWFAQSESLRTSISISRCLRTWYMINGERLSFRVHLRWTGLLISGFTRPSPLRVNSHVAGLSQEFLQIGSRFICTWFFSASLRGLRPLWKSAACKFILTSSCIPEGFTVFVYIFITHLCTEYILLRLKGMLEKDFISGFYYCLWLPQNLVILQSLNWLLGRNNRLAVSVFCGSLVSFAV